VRVVQVRLQRFRGYFEETIRVAGHVAVVGEARAGRTDLISALRRVLDPRSTAARPNPLDLHRPLSAAAEGEAPEATEVEVTLVDLGDALEQDLEDRLDVLDPTTWAPADSTGASDAIMGLRLCYRLRVDDLAGTSEHWVDYPKSGSRAPRSEREALPVVVLDRTSPLQLRADGTFRRLASQLHEANLLAALEQFADGVVAVTGGLAASPPVRDTINQVMQEGPAQLLGLSSTNPADDVSFLAEDGSVSALLRAVQPAMTLDDAGSLPLASHGSTVTGVLSVAEATAAARAPGAVVIADDFGDDLDAGAGEYLAARLRRQSGQVWISTRRPEVVRAFRAEEILRLTRSHGQRQHHQLAPVKERKARVARRHLHLLLLPAMTAPTVALLEGPHDLEGYSAVADRRLRRSGTPPPAAYGVRMVAAGLGDGGKDQLPRLAAIAGELGFHVRVVLDHDKPGTDTALVAELEALAEQVIRLPERTAVERALVRKVPVDNLRKGFERINDEFELGLDLGKVPDADLESTIVGQLKKKGGLHQPFVDALPPNSAPPLAVAVLDALCQPSTTPPLLEITDK
jgi:putative ATP-dependent endonuclease of OLD family